MKTIIFELSMPGHNSWNGKWSGEGGYYAIKKRVKDSTADRLSGATV